MFREYTRIFTNKEAEDTLCANFCKKISFFLLFCWEEGFCACFFIELKIEWLLGGFMESRYQGRFGARIVFPVDVSEEQKRCRRVKSFFRSFPVTGGCFDRSLVHERIGFSQKREVQRVSKR